tara:strand:- start:11096 stop:11554 length:459 start_codon:yes stop_codon:yes gene_type:complete
MKTTTEVVLEQQAINRKLWAKENRLSKIAKAKALLEKEGYCTSNLWHVDDVMEAYNVNKEEALDVLEDAMTCDWIMREMHECIDNIAEAEGYKAKESDVEPTNKYICGSCGDSCNEYTHNSVTDVDECNDCKAKNVIAGVDFSDSINKLNQL